MKIGLSVEELLLWEFSELDLSCCPDCAPEGRRSAVVERFMTEVVAKGYFRMITSGGSPHQKWWFFKVNIGVLKAGVRVSVSSEKEWPGEKQRVRKRF